MHSCSDKNVPMKSQSTKSSNEKIRTKSKKNVQIITSSGVPVPMEGIWAYLGFTASVYFDQWLFSTDSLGWTIAFLLYYPWPKDAAGKGCVICNLVLVLRRTSWRQCSVHRPSVAQLTSPFSSIGFAMATPLTIIPQTFDFPTRSTWPTWRQGWAGMTFEGSGMGRELKKPIPEIREREGNWKSPFPKFGNGKGIKKSIPKFREWEGNEKIPFPKFGNRKGIKKSIPKIREGEGK